MKFQVLSTIAATLVVGSQAQATGANTCLAELVKPDVLPTLPECYTKMQESETTKYTCGGDNGDWESELTTSLQQAPDCYAEIGEIISDCKAIDVSQLAPLRCLAVPECLDECTEAAVKVAASASGAVPVGMSTVATAAVMAAAATQLF